MHTRHHCARLLACAAFLTLVSAPHLAYTQDASDPSEKTDRVTVLKKITVKAPKKGVANTPLAAETTAEQIDDEQISSFTDLGRSLEPGVNFNRTNGSVNIRGLEGPRVQTTIDGIPIPYLDDGARDADGGIDSFDFNELSSVDIVRGADSSRAGDGALGGAVVLNTLQPEDLIGDDKSWGGIFKFAYDSEDRSWSTTAAVATRFDNTAVLFQGGYKKGHETETNGDNDAYGAGRTEANPADFDQNNFLVKVKQYTETGHTFTLTGERFDRNKDVDLRTEQSVGGNYRPGDWDGLDDVQRDRISLNYEFEAVDDDALFDNANAVIYWQDLTRDSGKDGYRYTSVIGDYSRLSEVENRSFGGAGYIEKEIESGAFSHTLRAGGDFTIGKTTQYSSGKDSCAPVPSGPFDPCNFLHTNQADMPDVDSRKLGLYLEDEIAFGSSGFSLTPGLRYDWYDQSPEETAAYTENPNYDGMPPGQSDDAFSPKLLAKYQAAEDVELFAQWAMAFRSPTANELYLDYGAPGTYLRLGNENLKPETSNAFEVGAKLGDEDFGGRVTTFYNRYRNFIDTVAVPGFDPSYPMGITQTVNLDRVRIYGVELSGYKRFDNGFHINGSLTYADGKNLDATTENDKLGSVAPLKGVLGAGYATEIWGTDVTLIASKAVPSKSDASFKPAGYGIVDLTGWWKPEQAEGLTLRAGIYNVFDKTYYDAINVRDVNLATSVPGKEYYSEPGRTFKISLTQRF
ncbi:hemoglobin/transferrin/lactoferrin receptor protein [Pararhizobium capsulatum DSM 1112]|uniref:Hemoglobin/transferrin/lactoferrin receptor protein n=1 Tax=Pararhizobium capsulatum DSM 1112 TaxID=1121113 RepID=A0ABU0BU94_9HYPH|nr:TonB-dependent hemoglobin/transferrin/lactoferrin family receptor [Pararhizobium capsulatum]MDQ0321264.1 hemoglobin/transferrin/lactoferrin receptor protein [Pararhizobium capsulatum DSM 1112]